jgi:hypothetical protein
MNTPDILQQSIESLKAQGFSEEVIAIYLRIMEQVAQLNAGKEAPGNSFAQARRHSAGVSPVIINPDSQLTLAQQWAIACGADVSYGNGYYMNDLTTGLSCLECRRALGEQYDIDCTEEVMESLKWLMEEGHQEQFDMLWNIYGKLPMKEVKNYLRESVAIDIRDEAIMMQRLRNLRDAKETFLLTDPSFAPNMLIWDYSRIINLCRGSFDAGYLSAEVALEHIMRSAALIRKKYSSWRELSLSYQFARFIWKGFDEELFVEGYTAMQFLLINAGSPWVTLKWDEDIVL